MQVTHSHPSEYHVTYSQCHDNGTNYTNPTCDKDKGTKSRFYTLIGSKVLQRLKIVIRFTNILQNLTGLMQTDTHGLTTVCRLLSAGGTCLQIPQRNHGSSTNKVVGGEHECVCVCVWAVFALLCSQLFPLQVLQTSVTDCVSDCLYKVASDTFNLQELFYCVCQCIRMHGDASASHAGLQRLLLCGFRQTTHWSSLLWAAAGIGIIAKTEKKLLKRMLHILICIYLLLNWLLNDGSFSRVCECVCVCVCFLLSITEDLVSWLQLRFPQCFPNHND